jgi:hypothetical protein
MKTKIVNEIPQQVNGAWSLGYNEYNIDHPGEGLNPALFDVFDLTDRGYYPLVETAPPTFDPATQKVVDAQPTQLNGSWMRQYTIVALSASELDVLIPKTVTAVQAKEALLAAGLLGTLTTYLATAPMAQQIAWETSSTFDRQSQTLQTMVTALGLTSAQVDALFVAASKVVV